MEKYLAETWQKGSAYINNEKFQNPLESLRGFLVYCKFKMATVPCSIRILVGLSLNHQTSEKFETSWN